MLQNWQLLVFIAGIFSVAFNYVNRYVLQNGDDSTSYSWWFEAFRAVLFLPFCFLTPLPEINIFNIALFLAIGLAEFFTVYIYMKMHSFSELSISTIISQLRLVWVPVVAFLLLKEKLATIEYLGIVFIFIGQVVVAFPKKFSLSKGVKYALISSFLVSINVVMVKVATPIFPLPYIVVAMSAPSVIGYPIIMKSGLKRIIAYSDTALKKVSIAAAFNALAIVFLLLALRYGPVSSAVGVFQGISVLGVAAGIIFLKERGNVLGKIAGGAIVLLGMYFLI